MAFADLDGVKIYYKREGQGAPVIFLHGFGLDCRLWQPQTGAFSKTYEVICFDLRGFGKSNITRVEPYCHHDDLKKLMKALGLPYAVLVGASLGGAVALDFTLENPEMVTRLVLVDSTVNGYPYTGVMRLWNKEAWKLANSSGVESARLLWKQHPLFAPMAEHQTTWEMFCRMLDDYPGWHWNHRDPATKLDPPSLERLNEIFIPSLVIVGERDLPDFQEMADYLAAGLQNARKVILPEVGHLPNLEAAEAFNNIVLDFLRSG
jgi:pimeloyl-ACP methyl ester carboxylesterase